MVSAQRQQNERRTGYWQIGRSPAYADQRIAARAARAVQILKAGLDCPGGRLALVPGYFGGIFAGCKTAFLYGVLGAVVMTGLTRFAQNGAELAELSPSQPLRS
jgi:hypothetical protein